VRDVIPIKFVNQMKAVKKFTSFNDLKSSELKTKNYSLSLKKHKNFEKVILEIRFVEMKQANQSQQK
jgi:hypothetical protein